MYIKTILLPMGGNYRWPLAVCRIMDFNINSKRHIHITHGEQTIKWLALSFKFLMIDLGTEHTIYIHPSIIILMCYHTPFALYRHFWITQWARLLIIYLQRVRHTCLFTFDGHFEAALYNLNLPARRCTLCTHFSDLIYLSFGNRATVYIAH